MEFLNSLPFAVTDIAVVLLILLSGFLAFYRGFITEILAVAGWIAAAIVTLVFHNEAKALAHRYLEQYVSSQLALDVGGVATLFIAALIVFSIILRGVAHVVRGRQAGALDRLLGFFYGLARGLILLAVLWLGVTAFLPPTALPQDIREARVLPLVQATANLLLRIAPDSLRQGEKPDAETETRQRNEQQPNDLSASTFYNHGTEYHLRVSEPLA